MQILKQKAGYFKKAGIILLKVALLVILLVIILFLLALTPPVQRFLSSKTESFLQQKLGTTVKVGSISFNLAGNINLQNIYLEDKSKDTLLSGGAIKANLNLLKLFHNEVQVKDLQLKNITAKIKRTLPDTSFNFQFIIDAFAGQTTQPDTTQTETSPIKMALDRLTLSNIAVTYDDVVTGNAMYVRIGHLSAKLDTINPTSLRFDVPLVEANNLIAHIKQFESLVKSNPDAANETSSTEQATPMRLNIGVIDLKNIDANYTNDISAFYALISAGQVKVDCKKTDLENNVFHLNEILLSNARSVITLEKTEAVKEEIKKAIQDTIIQNENAWGFTIDNIKIDNNTVQFDDNNNPKQTYGMDYAHLQANDITLHAENFVMNPDSIAVAITEGRMKEKSGFRLDALHGNLLYAHNQSFIKDLYLKTPGTELKRNIILEYASYEALTNQLSQTVIDADIDNSHIQVKDILTFAPQLRTNPAFSNPSNIWRLNLKASGSMKRLFVKKLQFEGFENTQIDADGVLANLADPNLAGGSLTIRKFHTTKADIALFAGSSLDQNQISIPQSMAVSGTLSGNMTNMIAKLGINTSAGSVDLNGHFTNLTNTKTATYNTQLLVNNLQLGSILNNRQIGSLSGKFSVNGKGFDPDIMHTDINGVVNSFGFNNYQYHNISFKGNLNKKSYVVITDANDPNLDFKMSVSGSYAPKPTIQVNGFIDSIKTLPLKFTSQPFIFRGKIEGDIPSIDPDNLKANVLITNALLVSDTNRLNLDTLRLITGRSDTGQFIHLTSNIIAAQLSGQYRLTELGTILSDNILSYLSDTPYHKANVQPYNITFTADVPYSPILNIFAPGLTQMETVHASGQISSGRGLQAAVASSYIVYQANKINNVSLQLNTSDSGLMVKSKINQVKSSSFDWHNVQLNATALNNNIDFNLGIDDKSGMDIYTLGGKISQPKTGDFIINLKPDSLILNHQQWNIPANNSLSLISNQIIANNFVLQKDDQQLSIQSTDKTSSPPLNIRFSNFRISTVTGFIQQQDSLMANGTINGNITLRNLLQQPVFTSDINISNLSFQQDTIGNIALKVNSEGNKYNTNATVKGSGNDVALSGYFEPQDTNDIAMNFNLAINKIELAALEGLSGGFLKSASGSVNGNANITGTTSRPLINGKLNFDSSRISTTLLGGPFTIHDKSVQISENGIHLDNFTIRDSANNELTLSGDMQTQNFINYAFNINVKADKFKVVNTSKKDNKVFYGDMVISSRMHIGGTETKPAIDGTLTVNKGTDFTFVVPQPEPGVVEREGIVEFVDLDTPPNDSLFQAYDSLNKSSVLGFDIAANIEIQKEAGFNIVIDAANGDFLHLQGTAQLSAGIDQSGKTSLTGTYEIEEGTYQLTFNFLQKKFTIEKGSKISWLGEPTDAQLEVTAIYIANTAPLDLVEGMISEDARNYYMQKLPFQLKLNLTGELLKPQITFDILLPEDKNYNVSNDVISTVNTGLTQLRQESSEMNKQVLSLLVLNRFIGANPFSSGSEFNAGSFARQSVSKLLTEQLNQLASGLIEGVDLNFGVASTDDYSSGSRANRTDLNVGISKRLLNDRLMVTVGSDFLLEGQQQSNQRSTNIAGNIAINYKLSRDGRYMLRFYRKDEYEGAVEGYIVETGVGFSITVDYNRFRELFYGRKKQIERSMRKGASTQ